MIKHVFLLIICQFMVSFSSAQTKEGFIEYVIEVQARDTTLKIRQQVALLRNSTMKVYFMHDRSRIDFVLGEMYTVISVVNWKTNRSLSLFTTPKGKIAVKMEATKFSESQNPSTKNTSVELIDKSKTILGYNCKKAILKTDSAEYVYWYTPEITIDLKGQSIVNNNIPGFPMEFEMVKDGVFMNFKIANLTFKVDKGETIFSTAIPSGYTVLSDLE